MTQQLKFGQMFAAEEFQPFTLQGENGKAVLGIHGFPGSPRDLRPTAHFVNAHGWTARAILLPGYGTAIDDLPAYTLEDWQYAIEQAVEALRRDHDVVIFAGHSLGGALALSMASPCRADGLILYAPFTRLSTVLWDLLPTLRHIIRTIKPFSIANLDLDDPETRAGVQEMMQDIDLDDPDTRAAITNFTMPTSVLYELHRAGTAAWQAAPDITVPTIIFQGMDDELVKRDDTLKLYQRLPNAQYHDVDGAHNINESDGAHWTLTTRVLEQFLTRW